jgi:hypothetical protein
MHGKSEKLMYSYWALMFKWTCIDKIDCHVIVSYAVVCCIALWDNIVKIMNAHSTLMMYCSCYWQTLLRGLVTLLLATLLFAFITPLATFLALIRFFFANTYPLPRTSSPSKDPDSHPCNSCSNHPYYLLPPIKSFELNKFFVDATILF